MQQFTETDGDSIRILKYDPVGSVSFKTEKQQIDILNTVLYGRALFINGILQSAERDEQIYHTALMNHLPGHLANLNNICILGGGEGASAREFLKKKIGTHGHVTMIDWDKELVTWFHRYEPIWTNLNGRNIFDDPRLTVEHDDVFELIKETRSYDAIFVDLVDPDLTDPRWKELFLGLPRWIKGEGLITINAGSVLPWDHRAMKQIVDLYKSAGYLDIPRYGYPQPDITTYTQYVPSFGSEWGFVCLRVMNSSGSKPNETT
jgi:spermidine synthase